MAIYFLGWQNYFVGWGTAPVPPPPVVTDTGGGIPRRHHLTAAEREDYERRLVEARAQREAAEAAERADELDRLKSFERIVLGQPEHPVAELVAPKPSAPPAVRNTLTISDKPRSRAPPPAIMVLLLSH